MKNFDYLSATLLAVVVSLLSACSSENNATQVLQFQPKLGDLSLRCNINIELNKQEWQIDQWQFFISELQVRTQQGQWQTVSLVEGAKQTKDVALLGEVCTDSTASFATEKWQINFEGTSQQKIQQVKFTLGIPFTENHANPLTQPSPINDASMFWVWRTGHKFMRLELTNASANTQWMFHLGSTGCSSASPVRSPQKACVNPNKYSYTVDVNGGDAVTLDLAQLLKQVQLNEFNSCQSEPDNVQCQQLFENLADSQSPVFKGNLQ